jgi:hypothetical protein
LAIILDADHVGFSFSSLFLSSFHRSNPHYELYEQVFAIDLVSLPISTSISSEATREKTSVTFSQSLNLSVVVRCLDVIYLKLKYVARNVRPVAASFRLLLAGSWRTVSICIQKSSHRISFCFPYFSSSLWVFSALAYCWDWLSLSNILTTPQWISRGMCAGEVSPADVPPPLFSMISIKICSRFFPNCCTTVENHSSSYIFISPTTLASLSVPISCVYTMSLSLRPCVYSCCRQLCSSVYIIQATL